MPPYVIFHDSTLREMAATQAGHASTRWPQVSGVGAAKLERYGEAFVEVIGVAAAGADRPMIGSSRSTTTPSVAGQIAPDDVAACRGRA